MSPELKLGQDLRMRQQLVMTPQLQQAIKILQLALPELEAVVQSELESNPLLEMVEERSPNATAADDTMAAAPEATPGSEPDLLPPERQADAAESEPEWNGNGDEQPALEGSATEARDAAIEMKEDRLDKLDWREYLENYSNNWQDSRESENDDDRRQAMENTLTRRASLEEHLMWQLRMSTLGHDEQLIGGAIIYNLNDAGYLETPLEELARQLETENARVERVLRRVQRFDPPGVAARDLRECLQLQLINLGMEESLAARVVLNHLDLLERHRYAELAKALGVPLEVVGHAAKVISLLEPKPGRD
jgi:RNA polymerase sigma-54 factor